MRPASAPLRRQPCIQEVTAQVQPRMQQQQCGRIARFSLDALVNTAAALGRKVTVSLDDAA